MPIYVLTSVLVGEAITAIMRFVVFLWRFRLQPLIVSVVV